MATTTTSCSVATLCKEFVSLSSTSSTSSSTSSTTIKNTLQLFGWVTTTTKDASSFSTTTTPNITFWILCNQFCWIIFYLCFIFSPMFITALHMNHNRHNNNSTNNITNTTNNTNTNTNTITKKEDNNKRKEEKVKEEDDNNNNNNNNNNELLLFELPFITMILHFVYEFNFGLLHVKQIGWEASGHRTWMLLNGYLLLQSIKKDFSSFSSSSSLSLNTTTTITTTTTTNSSNTTNIKQGIYKLILGITIFIIGSIFIIELQDYSGIYTLFIIRFINSLCYFNKLYNTIIITTNTTTNTNNNTNNNNNNNQIVSWSLLLSTIVPGIVRLIATSSSSIVFFHIVQHSILLNTLYCFIFVWDCFYIIIATWYYFHTKKTQNTTNTNTNINTNIKSD